MLKFQTSISFVHEIGTRVRISLMRSISRRQKDRDPQAVCSISAFSARPLLRYNFTATRSIHFHRRWVMTSLMCNLLVRTIKNILVLFRFLIKGWEARIGSQFGIFSFFLTFNFFISGLEARIRAQDFYRSWML